MKKIHLLLLLISFCSFGQTGNVGLYFDGVNDFLDVPKTTNIDDRTTNNRTYETAFKVIDATLSTKQVIMEEGGGTRAVIIYVEAGYLYVGAYNRSDYTPTWQGTFYREPILSDTWYHVALILDNAVAPVNNPITASDNNALKWYLDGEIMGQISGYQFGPHNPIHLGRKNGTLRFPNCGTWTATGNSEYCFNSNTADTGVEYYFNGYIWGFRVWNDVRTPAEILANKNKIITNLGTENLAAALDGDSFTYLNDSNVPAETTIDNVTTIIWSATAGSTDWNTGVNWEGGVVPNSIQKQGAQIQVSTNYPTISSNIAVGDLTIDLGATANVSSGGTLDISYDLVNNGTLNILDSGSLILRQKKVSSGSGVFNVTRNTPIYSENNFYSYWSSPVTETDSNIGTVFSDAELIYAFNSSDANSDWILHGLTNFSTGVGYAVQNEGLGGQERVFSGKINEGDVEVDIYNTSNLSGTDNGGTAWSTEGDNLIGNPYASAIDWDLVIADPDNSDIEGELYFWNQNTSEIGENNVSDYLQYNVTGSADSATGIIGSAQGFFVKALNSGTVTFKPSHQIPGSNNTFYKGLTNRNKKKLDGRSWFYFNHKNKTNTLLIGFLEGATDSYDRLYDGPYDTSETSMGFYSLAEEIKKTSIQGLPILSSDTKDVKLGFVIDKIGEYTIGLKDEYIDDEYFIYLLDSELKEYINLREKDYIFTINEVGENNTRFKIIYTKEERKTLGINSENLSNEEFSIFTNEAKLLKINYTDLDLIKNVSIYNILGSKLFSFSTNEEKNISKLVSGIYVVNVLLHDNRIFTKKIIISDK